MVTLRNISVASVDRTTFSVGWHYLAVRWSVERVSLFVDGVEVDYTLSPSLPDSFTEDMSIGTSLQHAGQNFNSLIDDLRISSRARTDEEILQSYQAKTLPCDGDTTYLMRMDGNLQPTEGGAYGLLVRDKSGRKTILDENGILQTWQEGRADNVESGKPLVLNVFLPTETRQVNKAILRFKRQEFRAYEKAAASGGATTSGASSTSTTASGGATTSGASSTSTTASGGGTTSGSSSISTTASGGDHRHQMFYNYWSASQPTSWRELKACSSIGGGSVSIVVGTGSYNDLYTYSADGDHKHDMQHTHTVSAHEHGMQHTHTIQTHTHGMEHTHTISNHTHPLDFGIYTGTSASNVTVKINGADRTSALGGGTGFNVDKDDLNITPYMQVGQWNVIELGSTTLGRIDATVFIQALMGVS